MSSPAETESDECDWDLVVRPHGSIFSLPAAELWRYRDLLMLFVRRDIVAFYKQTILGPIWIFLQPMMTTAIYVVVFGRIAGLSTDGVPMIPFYLCGITFWNYFAECLLKTSTVFRDNAGLFGKVYFPRMITPLSIVASSLFRFSIQLILLILVSSYYFSIGLIHVQATILLFPFLVVLMAMMGLGIGMLFSAMTTRYRDLAFLLQFGVQLLMYATPVIYPMSQVPVSMRGFMAWNPFTSLFETARHGILGAGQFSPLGLLHSTVFAVAVLIVATVVFNRVERTFLDTV